ncbi:MAG TPA: iron ABC transporter permease [Clostridiaceae bacterium]|nr:iron ABC transporter permease [Clostridiaceae bacterium]
MKKNASTLSARSLENRRRAGHFRMLLKQPVLLALIILIFVALFIFVLYPLLNVFRYSIVDENGAVSLAGIAKILGDSGNRKTFFNSIKLGVTVAVISTFLGYIFAFAMTRTEIKGKRFFDFIATLPIISPPFVLSLSIIFLFGRQGLITKGLLGITNSNVYGFWSLVVIQSISFFPIAYMTLTGILQTIDDSVEDAAFNLGASRGYIFRTVILPLSLPGIASSMLLVFIQSLEDFSNPAVLGGDYSTLAVEAYRIITGMYDMRGGSILAITLLLPTLTAFILQKYWVGKKSFVTVSGKPTQKRRKIHEPHILMPLQFFCILVSAIILLLYGTVLCGAFVKTWGVNFQPTLDHFRYIFALGMRPLWNSIKLALASAPISGLLGMVIAYLTVRKTFPGKRLMSFLSVLMFAIPGTVLGIGYVFSFNTPPLVLTGTATILIVAFTFRNIPVAIESGSTTLMQIDPSIGEASTVLGASSGTTFKRITLPLLRQAFFSGLVYAFVRSMTAVSSIIFLISPKWSLATARVFALFESSKYSDAAAYIVLMIVTIMIFIGGIRFLINFIFNSRYRAERKLQKLQQSAE